MQQLKIRIDPDGLAPLHCSNERSVMYSIELLLNLSKHPYLVPPWRKQLRPPNSAEYVLMAEAMIVTALSTNDDDLEVFN